MGGGYRVTRMLLLGELKPGRLCEVKVRVRVTGSLGGKGAARPHVLVRHAPLLGPEGDPMSLHATTEVIRCVEDD